MIPQVEGPISVADEAALVTAIKTLATTAGWTVVDTGTVPANAVWFNSVGEDGAHHIVGGVVGDTAARKMQLLAAADIDNHAIVNASVGGYVNDDTVGTGNPVQAPSNTSSWATRDAGQPYRYLMAINKDAISVLVTYQSGGNTAQGVLHIGRPEPVIGRKLYIQARAKIASTSGTAANHLITLDRDITRALKDGSVYGSDPHTMALQFHAIATGAGDAPEFAMLERAAILSGTLATVSGQTQFEIDTTTLTKLGARYPNGRGVGDIVSLTSEPNLIMCGARSNSTNPFTNTFNANTCLLAWDAYCGQRANLNWAPRNLHSGEESGHDPDTFTARNVPYPIYAISDAETGVIAQSDNQGQKQLGALKNMLILPALSQPDLSFARLAGDLNRRYRIQAKLTGQGLDTPFPFVDEGVWAVGPGW